MAGVASVTTPDDRTVVFTLTSRPPASPPGSPPRPATSWPRPRSTRGPHVGHRRSGRGRSSTRLVAAERPLHRHPQSRTTGRRACPTSTRSRSGPSSTPPSARTRCGPGRSTPSSPSTRRPTPHFHDAPGYQSLVETSPVVGSPTMGFMLLNCARPPTDDLRIRPALAKATDQVGHPEGVRRRLGPAHRRHLPARLALLPAAPATPPTTRPGPRRWSGRTRPSTARRRSQTQHHARPADHPAGPGRPADVGGPPASTSRSPSSSRPTPSSTC